MGVGENGGMIATVQLVRSAPKDVDVVAVPVGGVGIRAEGRSG